MAANTEDVKYEKDDQRRAVVRRVVQVGMMMGIFVLSIFLSAGRIDWLWGWIYVGLYLGLIGVNALTLDRSLVAERSRIGENTKRWDTVLASLSMLLVTPGALIVAGLDARFGWSRVGLPLQIAAVAGMVAGMALVAWAMATNSYFATTVRIQEDRGHTVVSGGPYAQVRHPSYLAFILMACATPVLLDSWWGLIPALLGAIGIGVRTALEDRTLREELPGYREYAARVRYRLVPGIW